MAQPKQISYAVDALELIPTKGTEGSAGWDLRAAEDAELKTNCPVVVRTGLYLALPVGWEAQVRSRSGLAKHGVHVMQGVGTIDSDYRGEIKVILNNVTTRSRKIERGQRIAQLVFAKVAYCKLLPTTVDAITNDKTGRGSGGFGSTGTS